MCNILGIFDPMEEEKVILVDFQDQQLGTMGKMEAHEKAELHRAFSIFILNSNGELLLQQRAFEKYHSPGLWTNTCCSHQREGESNLEAGKRRLMEEMGMTVLLEELFFFIYKAPFDNGLTEHELDHVMVGYSDEDPIINTDEVAAFKWVPIDILKKDLLDNPDHYTVWFTIIFDRFCKHLEDQSKL